MEALINYLNSIHPLTEEGVNAFANSLKVKQLEKKDFLLKAGHVCQNIYFISQGLLRCFYHIGDHEVCSWFMKEGDIIISVESFFQQKRSYESIQALEDCVLYYMHYNELQRIYRQHPEFNFVGRVLTEKYYIQSEQRLYSIRMHRSQERYDYLLEHNPELLLRVPAKHLSSYLGITEVTMSKIKARM
jgi:CRP-like cAMP-binding protein